MEKTDYFATTSRGLEEILEGEIRALGGWKTSVAPGGVSFQADPAFFHRANLWLRTANRVLIRLSGFFASAPEELYEGVRAIPWPDLFDVRRTIAVEASVRDSAFGNDRFAAQKTKDAVVDRFRDSVGRRPDVNLLSPDVRIHVRIVRNDCIVSLETSGESLNRRGYRTDPGEASLRETLAAGIVLLSGWDGKVPLLDPMCGAGTIPIEAALLAANIAPGLLRSSFGFMKLASYRQKAWEAARREARDTARGRVGRIGGSDISEAAVRAAGRNADNAGVSGLVSFEVRDIRDFSPGDPPGILLCNPPYGFRLSGEGDAIAEIYRTMGETFKKRCAGWTAYVLSGDPAATRPIGLKASRRFPLANGPIDCRLLRYELY